MRIDTWKVMLFFLIVLIAAYRIYPTHMEMASYFERSFMYQQALEQVQEQLRISPSIISYAEAARLNEHIGNVEEAIKIYYKILQDEPLNRDAHINLVRIHQWSRDHKAVTGEYERYCALLEQQNQDISDLKTYKKEVYAQLRAIYSYNGEYKNLIEVVEKQLALNPEIPEHYILLMNLYLRARNRQGALDIALKGCGLFPDDPVVLQDAVYVCTSYGDLENARKIQEKIVAAYPEEKNFWMALLSIIHKQGDVEELENTYLLMIERFPGDYTLKEGVANLYYEQNDLSKSSTIYIQLLEEYPQNTSYLKQLGDIFAAMNDVDSAIIYYRQFSNAHPENLAIIEQLMNLYIQKEDFVQADIMIEQYRKNAPNNIATLYTLADFYEWASQPLKAAQCYEKIIIEHPENNDLYLKLARNYEWAQYYDKAAKYIEQVMRLYPDVMEHKTTALNVYVQLSHTEKTIALANELISKDPENTQRYETLLARLYVDNRNFEQAYPYVERMYERNPHDIQIAEEFAWVCESLKKESRAMAVYQGLIRAAPVKTEWLIALLNIYAAEERFSDAVALYEKHISVVSVDSSVLSLIAQAYIELGQHDTALEILQKIITEDTSSDGMRRIAYIYYLKKDYAQAEKIFAQLHTLYPTDSDILQTLSHIYGELGQNKNAIQFLERYVSQNAGYEPLYTLAALYEQIGDTYSAQRYYQKTLDSIFPSSQNLKSIKIAAVCFQKTGKSERAITYYESAIRQDSADIQLVRDYCAYLVFDRSMPERAIEIISSAPITLQNDAVLLRYRAQAHITLKQFDFAESIVADLLKTNPTDPDLLMDMAFIMQNKGRWDNALKIYQDVMRTRNDRSKEAEREARSLLKIYAPQVRTGYLLIEEINKDTSVYHSQAQAYLMHNLLVRAGFARYVLRDNTNAAVGKIREYVSEWSIELEYFIHPDWSVQFGPFVMTNSPEEIYTMTVGIEYNNHEDLFVRLSYSSDDKLLDTRTAVPYGGRSDHVDFAVNWNVNDVIRLVFEGVHSRYEFSDKVREFGLSRTPGTRDHFIAGVDVTFLHDPRVALQYRYIWDDTRIDRGFDPFFPITTKTRGHELQLRGEQHINENLFVHGTFLVGHDEERDLFLSDLAVYGYEFGGNIEITDHFELGGYYQFRYEKGFDSQAGRTHYVDVHGVIHF